MIPVKTSIANKSNGGKDVIMVFQDGRSEKTGAQCPEIVGKLRDLIANLFQAFFLVTKSPSDATAFVYQTWHNGLAVCKHTFNKPGPNGTMLSILDGHEPADLGALFNKIEAA